MRTALLVCVLVLSPITAPPIHADSPEVLRWELVGHIADAPVAWIAVPPDGTSNGPLFARVVDPKNTQLQNTQLDKAGGSTLRSRDGGKTWEQAANAPGPIVLPPGGALAFSLTSNTVLRSTDAGQTWSAVASLAARELLFSPGFASDGIAYIRSDTELWRSTDRGATWTNLDPGAGQIVSAARLSPSFAADHTLFAGAISARPTIRASDPPATDNGDSLGVLVSHDAGSTWTSLADGLQIDDDAYRQVLDLAVSPNFNTDQTLYVSSLGPWQPRSATCTTCAAPAIAIFRSQDGGASWTAVSQQSLQVFAIAARLRISPSFDVDPTLLFSVTTEGYAPSQSGCELTVSTDGGDSWQDASQRRGLNFCAMGIARAAGTSVLLGYRTPYYLSNGPNRNINHSLDGGTSWSSFAPPGDGALLGFEADLAARQVVLPDRVLQATTKGDLWAYGGFAPCAIQPMLGFGQVWSGHPDWQDRSGCPVAQEQAIDVQTRHQDDPLLGPTDYYWTSSPALCVRASRDSNGELQGANAAQSSCAATDAAHLTGSILRFANDQYWLYVADAPGHGVVVSTLGGAAEINT